MKNIKSPFFVVQNFLEPLLCENITDSLKFFHPDTDADGIPQRTIRGHEDMDLLVYDKFSKFINNIEKHYGVKHRGVSPMIYEWYTEGCKGYIPHCENSDYTNNKWIKTSDIDFTGVIFMSEYQDTVPFDSDFEVFGGKLDFSFWNFGLNPQMGTLVIFPSCPNFVNATSTIKAGDLYQIRFNISTDKPFVYDRANFPGEYTEWFKEFP